MTETLCLNCGDMTDAIVGSRCRCCDQPEGVVDLVAHRAARTASTARPSWAAADADDLRLFFTRDAAGAVVARPIYGYA